MFEGIAFLVLLAVPVVIVLVEVVDWLIGVARKLCGPGAGETDFHGAFTLRRPDLELRQRHRHRVRFGRGRPSEIVRHQVEPYVR